MTILEMALSMAAGSAAARSMVERGSQQADGRPTVIACDFDGTLCHSDYPRILEANASLIRAVQQMQRMGYVFILWTCREKEALAEALDWLDRQGVHDLVVNDNCEQIKELFGGYNSRKVFADEYWDDKAVKAVWGVPQ